MPDVKDAPKNTLFTFKDGKLHYEQEVLVERNSVLDKEHGPAIISLIGSGVMGMSLMEACVFPFSEPIVIYKRGKGRGKHVKYTALVGVEIGKYINANKKVKNDLLKLMAVKKS